jgi:uncharacterized protein (DUF1810 family)
MADAHKLQRFVDAQDPLYAEVCEQLRAGRKRSHWMWFIFPQLTGLGRSAMANAYSIASREEAGHYLAHPVLGPRLRECTRLVTAVDGRAIADIFAPPDDLKFHSSMTLFAHATPDNRLFLAALQKYFGGAFDARTLARL